MRLQASLFIVAIVAMFVAIVAYVCFEVSGFTIHKSPYELSHSQFVSVLKRAMSGDAAAADTLGDYYFWGAQQSRSEGLGLLFREQAALSGSEHAKKHLRAFFSIYSIDIFREMTGRTNAAREQQLLEAIKKPDGSDEYSQ